MRKTQNKDFTTSIIQKEKIPELMKKGRRSIYMEVYAEINHLGLDEVLKVDCVLPDSARCCIHRYYIKSGQLLENQRLRTAITKTSAYFWKEFKVKE